jgi:RNA polymerase sigma factor (sigma-70 family)
MNADCLPNGRNKVIFEKECIDFMETFHNDLIRYALHHMRGDKEKAHDLLHDTFVVMLKGGDNIDFTRAPRKYFNMMMTREMERSRRVNQRKFEQSFVNAHFFSVEEGGPKEVLDSDMGNGDFQGYEEWTRHQREDTTLRDMAMKMPQLMAHLTPVERTHLEWLMDGLSYEEMQVKHPVSITRIGHILTRARRKLKKIAEAHLQDVG